MKFIQKIKQRIKMIKDKKAFSETMYDYNNINEYFSYYGDVIYISSDYLRRQDYFLILKNGNKFTLVNVSTEDLEKFDEILTRDHIIRDLDALAERIQWVEGLPYFGQRLEWHLLNTFLNEASRAELIRIKNSPLSSWCLIQIENVIRHNHRNKTIGTRQITQDLRQINPTLHMASINVIHAYNTQFHLRFDWVEGKGKVDITIFHFNHKLERKLDWFDIGELNTVLSLMSLGDEYKTSEELKNFII